MAFQLHTINLFQKGRLYMKKQTLKIKINVIWDKNFKDGEIYAEIFYKYFCSGELSVLANNIFSIPVRCFPIEDYTKRFKAIKNYLTVNILLADDYMRIHDKERKLAKNLENIAKNESKNLYIPIALTSNGCDYIDKAECVTAYQGEKDAEENSKRNKLIAELKKDIHNTDNKKYIILMLRRVLERIAGQYVFCCGNADSKKAGLFICHTKSTGLNALKAFQHYLASQSNATFFVDKNSIELGEYFDRAIYKKIPKSVLIVLLTDEFSTRDWCIKELVKAKKERRPILIVDALTQGDNRLFPYIGNLPVIKADINTKGELKNGDMIYEALVNESLWVHYNIHKNEYNDNVQVLPRKIELIDVLSFDESCTKAVYPEPPMGKVERDILTAINKKLKRRFQICMETEISAQMSKYQEIIKPKVMISSSSNPKLERIDAHCCCVGINYAVREITRYLIYLNCPILNAGNYKSDGFNRVIMEQIKQYYKTKAIQREISCIHYVNAYAKVKEEKEFVQYAGEYLELGIILKEVAQNATSRKESLKQMRDAITTDTDIQLVIGGTADKDGKKTGIDEEVELCIEKGKSIYLLGGFGFKAKELCRKYITKEGYQFLNNGLSYQENIKLGNMYDIGDILSLILKGWLRKNSSREEN